MKRLDQIISIASLTAAAAAAFATTNAAAQIYPARQILMVVPLQAGTAVDNVARTLAQRMTQSMGQTIVVENQAGAAGQIGTERVAKSAPDGYTIGFVNDSILTILPNINPKLPYGPLTPAQTGSDRCGQQFTHTVHRQRFGPVASNDAERRCALAVLR